ncbi:putative BTB/POZ domain-containing protein-like isoform X1 [Capsicum annuum]|nr:putative BTB/POZ domain-containing protein-like isoform X1 [Capsicum annuum]
MSFYDFTIALSLPYLGACFDRQLELDMETVVKVLQPGPLGIVEHKFSAEEIQKASDTVKQAVSNWRRHANTEKHSPIMKDFIDA